MTVIGVKKGRVWWLGTMRGGGLTYFLGVVSWENNFAPETWQGI